MTGLSFNGEALTPATIAATREHFADIYRRCIAEAESGAEPVNDLPRYVAWREELIRDALAGKHDHSFTFLQRAYWIQTGKSIALLS